MNMWQSVHVFKIRTFFKKNVLSNNEKSTIFVRFLWHFFRVTTSWVGEISEASRWLDQDWQFINDIIFSQFHFSFVTLYHVKLLANHNVWFRLLITTTNNHFFVNVIFKRLSLAIISISYQNTCQCLMILETAIW